MDEKELRIMMDCRKAIDGHKERQFKTSEDHTASVNDMLNVIQGHGFKSLQDYARWDDEKCLEAYIKYAPIEGECDHCVGYKGTPPCQVKWGERSCVAKSTYPTLEWVKKYAFMSTFRAPDKKVKSSFTSTKSREAVTLCPEGHGFHAVKDRKDDDKDIFPFDLHWQVFG